MDREGASRYVRLHREYSLHLRLIDRHYYDCANPPLFRCRAKNKKHICPRNKQKYSRDRLLNLSTSKPSIGSLLQRQNVKVIKPKGRRSFSSRRSKKLMLRQTHDGVLYGGFRARPEARREAGRDWIRSALAHFRDAVSRGGRDCVGVVANRGVNGIGAVLWNVNATETNSTPTPWSLQHFHAAP